MKKAGISSKLLKKDPSSICIQKLNYSEIPLDFRNLNHLVVKNL